MSSYPTHLLSHSITNHQQSLSVTIHLKSNQIVYEGDIINCSITGEPTDVYWMIDNQTKHEYFYQDNPILFDPEPTPLNKSYVTLTVSAENNNMKASDSVNIQLKRLFFGDIHFHSSISDGYHSIDALYRHALSDNYLDFVCLTDHAEIINGIDFTPPQPLWMFSRSVTQYLLYQLDLRNEWDIIKDKVKEYYEPGFFTTLLGFEYSPGPWYPGGFPWSDQGHQDIGHINFYYRDVYKHAPEYSAAQKYTYNDIFKAMQEENQKGHLNICFPHHPLMKIGSWGSYAINWSFLANNISEITARNELLRGVETYSKWGTALGKYSDIPVFWPYAPQNCDDQETSWVENALWEWSSPERKYQSFALMASSDNHAVDRPGSASTQSRVSSTHPNPSGILAVYAMHNVREEIWDAMNACYMYGTQQLKIRANVRADGKMALGQWINCTAPLSIQVSALSTFKGNDTSNKSMCPHAYSGDELNYPLSDVWLIKKDTKRGQPWCKIIGHKSLNEDLAVITFEDAEVHPYDFYYVVISQKGEVLGGDAGHDHYMSFLGPIFIDKVTNA